MGWKFETGLNDDFDFEVTNAYFAFNAKIGQGGEPKMALHLEGKAEGGTYDSPTVLEGDTALLFSTGDKWMAVDDGAKVVHEAGSSRSFNNKATIARLLMSADEAGAPIRDRGEPEEAGIWVGLKLHFNRVQEEFKAQDGTMKQFSPLLVSGYVGEGEKAGGSGKGKATAAATSDSADSDVMLIVNAVGGAIHKRLQKLASESADYDTFAAEAVDLPKVKDDNGLQDIILDDVRGKAVYEAFKGE